MIGVAERGGDVLVLRAGLAQLQCLAGAFGGGDPFVTGIDVSESHDLPPPIGDC